MTEVTICNDCGLEVERDQDELYSVNRYMGTYSETGHLCSDCIPEDIVDQLDEREFDHE